MIFKTLLVVLVPKPGKGSFSQQRSPYIELPMIIGGVYAVEENLDKKYIFTEIATVQRLLQKDSTQVSGINFKLEETTESRVAKAEIRKIFGNQIVLRDRQELNSSLHRMLNTENIATYLIFTLVLIIALFNVVGAIIMMILDKLDNLRNDVQFWSNLEGIEANLLYSRTVGYRWRWTNRRSDRRFTNWVTTYFWMGKNWFNQLSGRASINKHINSVRDYFCSRYYRIKNCE